MPTLSREGRHRLLLRINGREIPVEVETRSLLSDVLRQELGLTGTHVGCEHGVCGACTVQIDGWPGRACLTLAVQAEGHDIRTVEDLAPEPNRLSALQEAFRRHHGLQCGFCTPGVLMSLDALLTRHPTADANHIRDWLSGHLCRCTGYVSIVAAAVAAVTELQSDD